MGPLATICHLSGEEIDRLPWVEFLIYVRWAEGWLEAKTSAAKAGGSW